MLQCFLKCGTASKQHHEVETVMAQVLTLQRPCVKHQSDHKSALPPMTIIFLGTSFKSRAPVEDTILQGGEKHFQKGSGRLHQGHRAAAQGAWETSGKQNTTSHRHAQGDSSGVPTQASLRPGQPSPHSRRVYIELAHSQCSVFQILALGASCNVEPLPPHLAEAAATPHAAISREQLLPASAFAAQTISCLTVLI